ncbi:MAG: hypothetical protein FJW38_16870 [Acidobacteria bacterium]|nr:hypothetical protein [Acidobacteriota bacterium]
MMSLKVELLNESLGEQARAEPKLKPVLTIEEFFEGNVEEGISIGCNLIPSIPLLTFRRMLEGIRGRLDVHALWLSVAEFGQGPEWPFVDEVLVLTSAGRSDLEKWFLELRPTEIVAINNAQVPPRCCNHGFTATTWFSAFWD